jgi:hypothetical protein
MAAWSVSQVFSKEWFWLATVAGLLVVLYFMRKRYPQPFPGVGEFLSRRREAVMETVTTAADVLVIGTVLLCGIFLVYTLREDLRVWSAPSKPPAIRAMAIQILLVDMIVWSGITGLLIGALSFFKSKITRLKRAVLLILCLFPLLFTLPALLIDRLGNPWLMIELGLIFSAPGWIENGSTVLIGQPLPDIIWRAMRRFHLVSGDLPD